MMLSLARSTIEMMQKKIMIMHSVRRLLAQGLVDHHF